MISVEKARDIVYAHERLQQASDCQGKWAPYFSDNELNFHELLAQGVWHDVSTVLQVSASQFNQMISAFIMTKLREKQEEAKTNLKSLLED